MNTKWQPGSNHHHYTLVSDTCQARVWLGPERDWTALITCDNEAVNHHFFKNLMEAQLWCEERLSELHSNR